MTRWQANGLMLPAALIWGSAFVGQVQGMDGVGPFTFTSLRFALGAAVVAPLAWREWRGLRAAGQRLGAAHLGWTVLLGGLLCLGVVMQQLGLMGTTVTNAGFLNVLYVPLVPVLAWAFQRQRPNWGVAVAVPACLGGTALLTGASSLDQMSTGDAWVMASALPWAVHVLLVGAVANRMQGAFVLACGQFVVCALGSGLPALVLESLSWAGLGTAAVAIAYTGILSVGVGFTLQVVGQRHAPAADAAILLSSETVFAAAFGALLMGDRLGATGWLGCGLILAGILLVQCLPLLARRAQASAH